MEKEVLFFPFSSFEIKDIKEVFINNEARYEIKLLYLGKYLKELQNDKDLIEKTKKIPDSEFKNQIVQSGLIKENAVNTYNDTKKLLKNYEKYKNDIDNNQTQKHFFENNNNQNQQNNKSNSKKKDIQSIFQSSDFFNLSYEEFRQKYKYYEDYSELKSLKELFQNIIDGPRLSKRLFDPNGNKIEGWSIGEKRGGKDYDPPLGWIGFGLKCKGQYDDDIWIGNKNSIGEWCVAYHGFGYGQSSSNVMNILGDIIKGSFKVEPFQIHMDCEDIFHPEKKVGMGLYCYTNIAIAEEYAGLIESNGKKFKILLMVRVKPDSIRTCSCSYNKYYLVINGTTDEVRPYRILFKRKW